jgi:hypothetical protein
MSSKVQCLACGCTYDIGMAPFCPRRYLSPHNEEWMQKVVDTVVARTGWDGSTAFPRKAHQEVLSEMLN